MEILFRGKDLYTSEWAIGNYCKAELLDGNGYEHFIIDIGRNGKTHRIDPNSLGQYIGLKDKFGLRAYEGDITEDEAGHLWVIFKAPGGFGMCRTQEYLYGNALHFYNELGGLHNNAYFMKNHTLIGNIHDNAELLRRKTC